MKHKTILYQLIDFIDGRNFVALLYSKEILTKKIMFCQNINMNIVILSYVIVRLYINHSIMIMIMIIVAIITIIKIVIVIIIRKTGIGTTARMSLYYITMQEYA